MQVKAAGGHSVRWLDVGIEGLVVEDAAQRKVRVQWLRQGRTCLPAGVKLGVQVATLLFFCLDNGRLKCSSSEIQASGSCPPCPSHHPPPPPPRPPVSHSPSSLPPTLLTLCLTHHPPAPHPSLPHSPFPLPHSPLRCEWLPKCDHTVMAKGHDPSVGNPF